MATSQTSEVIQHLRRAVLVRDGAGLTDGQLLEDYLSRRDEAALAALVRRHGPMVWGVCRRVLRDHHDAEDAFQATFLVLVRKAASIASPELLANWLYGVAHQTAMKAWATTAKRRARERQVTQMPERAVIEQDLWNELQPLLDHELSRLPAKYRVALVVCDLEGKTRKEAALQLGLPEGTVASRLIRARTMLAQRLARHGRAVSGGGVAAALAQSAASASVPTSVLCSTIKAASRFAAGQATATGAISPQVAALTEGVLKTMLLTNLKIATAVLLVLGITSLGAGVLTYRALGGEQKVSETKQAERRLAPKDEARALVERAVKAHGGDKLLKAKAVRYKGKMSHDVMGVKQTVPTETWVEFPDRFKKVAQFDVNGETFTMTYVYDGKQGWEKVQDETEELDAKTLKELQAQIPHDERIVTLTFLNDKGCELSPLGEIKIEDRPAAGVRVECKDRPAINLYFDKATSLLVKVERRGAYGLSGEEVNEERYFKDYKEMNGVKIATQIVANHDGRQCLEMEVTEYEVRGEGFGETFFAKP